MRSTNKERKQKLEIALPEIIFWQCVKKDGEFGMRVFCFCRSIILQINLPQIVKFCSWCRWTNCWVVIFTNSSKFGSWRSRLDSWWFTNHESLFRTLGLDQVYTLSLLFSFHFIVRFSNLGYGIILGSWM